MPRPILTPEQLITWNAVIDTDPMIPQFVKTSPIIREVCLAGQWLNDQLLLLDCPQRIISSLCYEAGSRSFAKSDPWIIHEDLLSQYQNGELQIEPNSEEN